MGKKMVVQATNTGSDLAADQFDISTEWGTPSTGWGAQYGGISSRSQCDAFPDALKEGCYWRFDWFGESDNPTVNFKQVACPAAITAKSGCVRAKDVIDETPTGPASTDMWTQGAAAATSVNSGTQVAAATTSVSSETQVVAPAAASSAPASSGDSAVTPVAHYG
ncbi:hypothetical protein G7Y89_g9269 [Cudoniella acicularis]|uniref:cellulase n=1 Tax=Cudoniella acicularis TaxID=354080 RepID=A0A8H4REZ7_9HELO|nr:hypothetical protein G7Y89_g9269 [Cudoniella acicularis]